MKFLSVAEIKPDWTSLGLKTDLEGWNSEHPLFEQLIKQTQPKVIVECGSWKGRSAIHMARLTRELKTRIYCCDTWLGEVNLKAEQIADTEKAACQYDHAAIYNQFLHNVSEAGFADRIFPIPQESIAAARLLIAHKIKADLVYLDADHSYHCSYYDLENYAPLVSAKGVLFGDDFNDFPGVRAAVCRFAFENSLRVMVSGPAWILQPIK